MIHFVTGATGFLGGRLVELLLEKGEQVIAVGRNPQEGERLTQLGAKFVAADLSDLSAIEEAMPEGAAVIHCAALSSVWGDEGEFFDVNVLGTQVVAYAALKKNAQRFIQISTPSIFAEKRSRENICENDELPAKMSNLYTKTKLRAEQVVRENIELGLPAIILRPHRIFGPNDNTIVPKILNVAKKGYIPVMNNKLKIDLTYVDNAVEAIFCALNAPQKCVGEVYNITNDQPVDQNEVLEKILKDLGYPVRRRRIPVTPAWKVASAMEWAYRTFNIKGEPPLTKHKVCDLGFTHTLSVEKAKRELGYKPKITIEQGLTNTSNWLQKYHA